MMMKENLKDFENKRVIITLSNQMRYTGKVISVGDTYIKIIDKWDKDVLIVIDNICSIEEEW